jgi:hypothetical protein
VCTSPRLTGERTERFRLGSALRAIARDRQQRVGKRSLELLALVAFFDVTVHFPAKVH